MGKRSDFARVERDFYPTPAAAVAPLVPHLEFGTMFVEPCAGDGALVHALEAIGMSCVDAYDIEPKADFIHKHDAISPYHTRLDNSADAVITNPPWNRKFLHPFIETFSNHIPTWLLFDADWVHTKQAAPYLPRLRKIVAVGRLKWIPDSPHTGKDNCCWHLFDLPSDVPAEFYGRVVA